MKDLEYENKMVDDSSTKTTKEVRKRNYVMIAPNGNQYSVPPHKLDAFKQTFNVNEHWTIK
jgi:predicted HAD superfamily phosphohydrolase